MSGWESQCPNCGAPVVFALGTSLLRVCDQCRSALTRRGPDLASFGKVAELVPTTAVLKLGSSGHHEEFGSFRVIGHLQLDHGSGVWDEWHVELTSSDAPAATGWIAEAQGRLWFTHAVEAQPFPAEFEQLGPEEIVELGEHGTWVVSERRTARFVSAEGELPQDLEPSGSYRYVDIARSGGRLGTLGFTADGEIDSVFLGRQVPLAELGIAPSDLRQPDEMRTAVQAQSLQCPNCGGSLDLRAPDETRRVGCPYCGSLLDAAGHLAVLQSLDAELEKPVLELGSTCRFRDVEWTAIGHLVRSVVVEGERYPWCEFLLYHPHHGFRWLVESSGHWSFVEPLDPGDAKRSLGHAMYQGQRFKHFQGAEAKVDQVLGECYWEVALGDTVAVDDFVRPPQILSIERDENESTWSLGTYVTREQVKEAFGLDRVLTHPRGVGANQPNPHLNRAKKMIGPSLLACLAAIFVLVFLSSRERPRTNNSYSLTPEERAAGTRDEVFTDTFEIRRQTTVKISLQSPVQNSWLYAAGALINEDNGDARPVGIEVSYWSGRSGGESWSEGRRRRARHLHTVPPGRYVLALKPTWDKSRAPTEFNVKIATGVTRLSHFFLALLAILFWPIVVGIAAYSVEYQRWQESDHPWSSEE